MVAGLAAGDRVCALPAIGGQAIGQRLGVDRVSPVIRERNGQREDEVVIFSANLVERLGAHVVVTYFAGAAAVPDAILRGVAIHNQWRIGACPTGDRNAVAATPGVDDRQAAMVCSHTTAEIGSRVECAVNHQCVNAGTEQDVEHFDRAQGGVAAVIAAAVHRDGAEADPAREAGRFAESNAGKDQIGCHTEAVQVGGGQGAGAAGRARVVEHVEHIHLLGFRRLRADFEQRGILLA